MLENGKSVVTTNFNNRNVPCTLDYKMSLLDIAALAASVDCVYGINTAPYIVAINKWSVPNVKKWVHLNDKHTYAGLNIVSFKTKEELDNAVGLE
jgi:hypothetical protein